MTSMLVRKSKPKSFHQLERDAISAFGEQWPRPQEQNQEYYRHSRKLNYGLLDSQLKNLPLEELRKLQEFQPSSSMLQVNPEALSLYPVTCHLIIVNSTELFDEMVSDLEKQVEISVDLEFHQRYSFRGTTALIQISTVNNDYLICPFITRDDILKKLAKTFTDPKISKVFHSIDNDYLALRRDFNINVIGAVDTKEAYKIISKSNNAIGFDNLMKILDLTEDTTGAPTKELMQVADWRLRPLPEKMIKYARRDSHNLLRAWNRLKQRMIDEGHEVVEAFRKTTALLQKLEYRPNKQEDPLAGLKTVVLPEDEKAKQCRLQFIDLHRWRLLVAQMVDCSPKCIMTNKQLCEIVLASPSTKEEMQALLNQRFPPFMKNHQGQAFLKVYVEGMRASTFDPTCHNCFLHSHQAWACWKPKDRAALKRYMKDPANRVHADNQYKRRMKRLAENRFRRMQQR